MSAATGDDDDHDHGRAGIEVQRRACDLAAAILSGDPGRINAAADAAECAACLAVAAVQLMCAVAGALAGDTVLVSEATKARVLVMVKAARRELGSAGN